MTKKLVLDHCPEEYLWKAFEDNDYTCIRVCLEKINLFFGQKDYSKSLILTFSDKPSNKKREKSFEYRDSNLYHKGKFIPTYFSLMGWIQSNFPDLRDGDKLYVRASQ